MKNKLRYDRSTSSGRYGSMLMDVPMMMDVIPNWHVDELGTGVSACGKTWSDKWAGHKTGHDPLSIDSSVFPASISWGESHN